MLCIKQCYGIICKIKCTIFNLFYVDIRSQEIFCLLFTVNINIDSLDAFPFHYLIDNHNVAGNNKLVPSIPFWFSDCEFILFFTC